MYTLELDPDVDERWSPFRSPPRTRSTFPSASACASLLLTLEYIVFQKSANESRINLEGAEPPLRYSTLLDHPELRHIGSNQR